ncbi:MAG: NADH:ubiquinone oxidoreductase subunit NDUFA12 [Alphaproteobacteria bacterium]|jgi:NADH:ubiquinone oxidoreductase subunit|nr:NADH:ubiquinone oxidoreductase subunit NDUFA12 [Alphaproteobacteria bacterium]MDP7222145.1 NADH:ubiquinone oxidoreductase subunit NDUFA12 [Alphaproteobacteria bacterium]
MSFFSILGVISPIHISLVTVLTGAKKIGVDQSGNKYFEAKKRKEYKHTRRWVIYKGTPDASKVPPEWHGWLHHQTDVVPNTDEATAFRKPWQKPHHPNPTGSDAAYKPPGHVLSGGKRDKATGDYEAWTPE